MWWYHLYSGIRSQSWSCPNSRKLNQNSRPINQSKPVSNVMQSKFLLKGDGPRRNLLGNAVERGFWAIAVFSLSAKLSAKWVNTTILSTWYKWVVSKPPVKPQLQQLHHSFKIQDAVSEIYLVDHWLILPKQKQKRLQETIYCRQYTVINVNL